MLRLRHPARHYIHWLLSRKTYSVAQIVERLSAQRFPLPQQATRLREFLREIVRVEKEMRFPPGYDPTAKLWNRQTADFLRTWGIAGLWRPDSFVDGATDLLEDPHVRRMTEVLLLGPMSPGSIATRVATRWDLSEKQMNARVVKEFNHYYWLYSCMNTGEWKDFFYSHYPEKNQGDYLVSLEAPRTQAGLALTVMISDRGAGQLKDVESYELIRNAQLTMYVQHALMERPSMARTQGAFFALQGFKMAAEELDKHRGASQELLEEMRNMDTVHDRSRVASLADLPIDRPKLEAAPPIEHREKEEEPA